MSGGSSSDGAQKATRRPTAPAVSSSPPRPSGPPLSHRRQVAGHGHAASGGSDRASPSLDALVGAALGAAKQTATSLQGLGAALRQLGANVEGALSHNAELARELEKMYAAASASSAAQREQQKELEALDARLEEERRAAEQEHLYIAEEQDRFVAALIEEHEEALSDLEQQKQQLLGEIRQLKEGGAPAAAGTLNPGPPEQDATARERDLEHQLEAARAELVELDQEREQARELVKRAHAQRDEAQAALKSVTCQLDELRHAKISSSPADSWDREATPAPPPSYEPPSSGIPQVLGGTQGAAQTPSARQEGHPTPPQVKRSPRPVAPSTPPETPKAATDRPGSSKPPLKRKPDVSERPLIGYSMGSDEVQADELGPSPPPRER